ncbi:MAG: hypothetical protein ACE15D_18865 [Candidatus Eisenbacteria bacterium]
MTDRELLQQAREALGRLSFMAQTSGGTTGRDDEMCAAISDATQILAAIDAALAKPERPTIPDRDTATPATKQGMFNKFIVLRVDRSDEPGGKHDGCEYFVLDVDHDPHAKPALAAYAKSCVATHPALSADMIARYGLVLPDPSGWRPIEGETLKSGRYLVGSERHHNVGEARWRPRLGAWKFPSAAMAFEPTHFMPLPPAPGADHE